MNGPDPVAGLVDRPDDFVGCAMRTSALATAAMVRRAPTKLSGWATKYCFVQR